MISFFNFVKNGLLHTEKERKKENSASSEKSDHEDINIITSVPYYRCDLNDVFEVRQTKKSRIGQGQFGEVFLGKDKATNEVIACKKNMMFSKKMKDQVIHEIRMMEKIKKCVDCNVVTMRAVVQDKSAIYIIMDAMKGGELFYQLKKRKSYSEKDASRILKTISTTVKKMHDNEILHRDLKPSNVMFRDKTKNSDLVLIDFGLSLDLKQKHDPYQDSPFVGTAGFAAPEVCDRKFSKSGDVYALGSLLYILLVGFPPFHNKQISRSLELYKKVTQNEEYFKMETHGWEHISKEAKHLVKHMLRGDPKARYTIDQVLTHPWISKNNNSGKILSKTVKNFVRTNARQRFRGAIRAIIMMNRLRALTSCGGKKRKCGKRKRDSVDVRKKKKKKSNGRRMKKK